MGKFSIQCRMRAAVVGRAELLHTDACHRGLQPSGVRRFFAPVSPLFLLKTLLYRLGYSIKRIRPVPAAHRASGAAGAANIRRCSTPPIPYAGFDASRLSARSARLGQRLAGVPRVAHRAEAAAHRRGRHVEGRLRTAHGGHRRRTRAAHGNPLHRYVARRAGVLDRSRRSRALRQPRAEARLPDGLLPVPRQRRVIAAIRRASFHSRKLPPPARSGCASSICARSSSTSTAATRRRTSSPTCSPIGKCSRRAGHSSAMTCVGQRATRGRTLRPRAAADDRVPRGQVGLSQTALGGHPRAHEFPAVGRVWIRRARSSPRSAISGRGSFSFFASALGGPSFRRQLLHRAGILRRAAHGRLRCV